MVESLGYRWNFDCLFPKRNVIFFICRESINREENQLKFSESNLVIYKVENYSFEKLNSIVSLLIARNCNNIPSNFIEIASEAHPRTSISSSPRNF